MQKKNFFIIIFVLWSSVLLGEVDPPNYDFSLDNLKVFFPGSTLEKIQEKYGKGEVSFDEGGAKIHKFYVSQIRYKFPVFVLIFKGQSLSFYARLPAYFLHDVFHQSLINRYGKQDEYNKVNSAAIYVWKNEGGTKFTYHGQCTINCFPVYLHGEANTPPQDFPGNLSILSRFMPK